MSEYKSLHERLLKDGYVVDTYFSDEKLPEGLAAIALDIARGKYNSVRIIPADLALEGEPWIPEDPTHLVYSVLSEEEQKSREGTGFPLKMLLCKHRDTGELRHVHNTFLYLEFSTK